MECEFCGDISKGGVYIDKQHLVGGFRDVVSCLKCYLDVGEDIKGFKYKEMERSEEKEKESIYENEDLDYNEDEEDVADEINHNGKRVLSSQSGTSNFVSKQKGLTDSFFPPRDETVNKARKKKLRGRVCGDIARWIYDSGLPFNCVRHPSFAMMIESIGQYGPGMKPPSYHEIRVPLLKKEVSRTRDLMKSHEDDWAKYGCSIMADGWTDKKQITLINFLVNSPKGSVFIKSIDATGFPTTGEAMFILLDHMVERIGEANVVQVVTDNTTYNILAGKLLQAKRPNLYWTPCVDHCINLMLEDIGKISIVHTTIKRAITFNGYICSRPRVLNMMRTFTGKKELLRPGKTRFTTIFLTLQRFHKQQNNLRKMFTSENWATCKWAKESAGKRATSIILMPTFWNNIMHILNVFGPLIGVLRLVDGEKKPAMGYIYRAMDKVKEFIAKSFNKNEEKYKEVFEIIDRRWECQLHHPLHAAGYFLNPEYFYSNPNIEQDGEVMSGLYKSLQKLVPSVEEQDKITDELTIYRSAQGLFGINLAIRHRATMSPVEWWRSYGASAPNLQSFSIKVLSLTCSASGCERNWSVFEHIYSKKKNMLDQQKLNDLVFVKYNRALRLRHKDRDNLDPISLKTIDDGNEWLLGRMDEEEEDEENELVFEDEDLTWGVVSRASGVGEALHRTQSTSIRTSFNKRANTSFYKRANTTSKGKGKEPVSSSKPKTKNPSHLGPIDEDECDSQEETEEDIGNDNSNDAESNGEDYVELDDEKDM